MDFLNNEEPIRDADRVFTERLIEQETISMNSLGIEELLESGLITEEQYLDLFEAALEAEKHTVNQIKNERLEVEVEILKNQAIYEENLKKQLLSQTLDQRIDYIKNRFKDVFAFLHRMKGSTPHYEKIIDHINNVVLPRKKKIFMSEAEFNIFDDMIRDLFFQTALVKKINRKQAEEMIDEIMNPIEIEWN